MPADNNKAGESMNGGRIVARVLEAQGVGQIYSLCGGHISPILVGCDLQGIRVIDVRDEASAVFAADATARMTGIPGVAAVTAGPGLTNTLTAVENARLAQTPLVVIGGATATLLRGRGALQDIDQISLMKPVVKAAIRCTAVRQIAPLLEKAFRTALSGVPGPVFVEMPLDILYDESLVRQMTEKEIGRAKGIAGLALQGYVQQHLFRVFRGKDDFSPGPGIKAEPMEPPRPDVEKAIELLARAKQPVLVVGAASLLHRHKADAIRHAVEALGIPVFLAGTARGLLGRQHRLQYRHHRGAALGAADLVIVCGFPFDFRMGYGWAINGRAEVVMVHRDAGCLRKNRRPTLAVHADPGNFLLALANMGGRPGQMSREWHPALQAREQARDNAIAAQASAAMPDAPVDPVRLCSFIESEMAEDASLVVDGGDFVATAAYIIRPRGPLQWLDPGVFGTLGVGGGFAMGAAAVRPGKETWLLYGDGACAYSLAEFDAMCRQGLAVIAVIGNDGKWNQIARDQARLLGRNTGCMLVQSDYHRVAEGYGARGLVIRTNAEIPMVLREARAIAAAGQPVVINALLGDSTFREGAISI
jgi:acetolactate synthase-like protein